MRSFLVLTCRLPAECEERLTEVLERWPVLGCQVEDARPEIVSTIFLGPDQCDALDGLAGELLLLGARELVAAPFADRDWLDEYRQHARPAAIGERWWIDPLPASPTPPPQGRLHLVVEPRRAFGTGSHESTRLVLEVLETLDLAGARVLDVGCGSGILALAACAMGARNAVGFDIDAEAVFVARQTAAVQPTALAVHLYAGSIAALTTHASFDLVLANLIPSEFLPFLAELRAVLPPAGTLVLSGLLADQRQVVESELACVGLQILRCHQAGEWLALVCAPT